MQEPEQRKFRADPLKLKRLRVAAGLTAKEVRELAQLDRTTVTKILAGDPVGRMIPTGPWKSAAMRRWMCGRTSIVGAGFLCMRRRAN